MARIFEQGEVTTPDITERLASGKSGTPTSNITIANFVAWLNSVLGFFKLSSNLADGDAPTMRTNLDVYSTVEIDNELDLKANKTNVLEKDNTIAYTPTSDYHPTTKSYVDNPVVNSFINAVKVYGGLNSANTSVEASVLLGKLVVITGQIDMTTTPAEDTVLLTFTSSNIPTFTHTHKFVAGDAGADENIELKALAGTKSIVMGPQGSTNSICYFTVSILVP